MKTTKIENKHWYKGDYIDTRRVVLTAMCLDLNWEEEYDPELQEYWIKLYK